MPLCLLQFDRQLHVPLSTPVKHSRIIAAVQEHKNNLSLVRRERWSAEAKQSNFTSLEAVRGFLVNVSGKGQTALEMFCSRCC